MCIYLTTQSGLNYKSAEHLIPAGLGGKLKLPNGYVSDEFNNSISKSEQEFLRSSIISLPRQLLGPGKRGSLNPKRETKSKITVFRQYPEEENFSLGYVQKGIPFEIPHIIFDQSTGGVTLSFPKEKWNEELQSFSIEISNVSKLQTRLVKFGQLPTDKYLLGIKKGIEENYTCFVASHDGKTNPFNEKLLQEISTSLKNSINPILIKSQVKAHHSAKIDINYYKCCAKIAFNFLAFSRGKDFTLDKIFDPLRNWIVNGTKNEFVQILSNKINSVIKFPEDSHQIIISVVEGNLIANITFYNNFNNGIILAKNYDKKFDTQGFICDWKNEKEYDLYEYIALSIQ